MTTIALDRAAMDLRLADLVDRVDDLDRSLGRMPGPPDGGIASGMIALIATAAAEANGLAADIDRAVAAIALDVVKDLDATEDEVYDVFSGIDAELGEL